MLINFQKPPLQAWEKRGLIMRHCFSGSNNDGIDSDHPDQILRVIGGKLPSQREGRPAGTGPRGRRGGIAQDNDNTAIYVKAQQAPQSGATWMCWVKPPTGGDNRHIFNQFSNSTPAAAAFVIRVTPSSGLQFTVFQDFGNTLERYGGPHNPGCWNHVAMRWDGGAVSGTSLQGFLNGIRTDTSSGDAGSFTAIYAGSDVAPLIGGGFWNPQFVTISSVPDYPQDDFRIYDRPLDPSEIMAIWAAGYQPSPDVISYVDAQSYELAIRPDADISDGTWTDQSGGTSLFAAIDEPTEDDTDYIQSADTPSNDVCEVNLSNFSAGAGQPIRVHYRYWRVGSTGSMELRVRLLQGATQIASWTHSAIGTSPVNAVQTLSGGEASAISDFTNLRLEFRANQT